MATMWAYVRSGSGMAWEAAQPRPQVKGSDVLVRVRAASINPVDYKVGKMLLGPVLGLDVAGVVEAASSDSGWKVGDEVFGTTPVSGSLAEFAVAKATSLARKPAELSWEAAAAYPVVYLTGLQALRDHSGMKTGDRVLVIGASGGTGIAGLQLAKKLGASEVVAICGTSNVELCKKFGADKVVDYRTELAGKRLKDVFGTESFDVIYDCATGSGGGEDYKDQGLEVMKNGRKMVAINGAVLDMLKFFTGCTGRRHMFFSANVTTCKEDLEFIAASGLQPFFAEGFDPAPLDETNLAKGFELLKSRRTRGKMAFVAPALADQA